MIVDPRFPRDVNIFLGISECAIEDYRLSIARVHRERSLATIHL